MKNNNSSLKWAKNIIAVLILTAATYSIWGYLGGIKAFAFSSITPIQASAPATNAANITGSGTNIQPWFAVGVGAYDGPNSYAKVYVPKGQSATLTVSQGNGVCGIDVGNPVVSYTITVLDNAETVLGGGGQIGAKTNSGSCGALTFNLSGGTPATRLVGHENYDVYYFEARITNGTGTGDNEKNFRLSVSNGLVGVSRAVKDYGAKPWFGIYMRDAPQRGGNNWDYGVQFSPYCNESSNPTRSVAVHDIDWQVYNQPSLSGLVNKDTREATGYNWNLAPPGEPTSKKVTNEWPTGNDTDANLSFTYNNDYRYLLEFRDIDWHNTIQISLPFDEFDSLPAVGQECSTSPVYNATCSPLIKTMSNQALNASINYQVTWTNTGQTGWTTSSPTVQYRTIVDGNPNSPVTIPGGVAVGNPFSHTFSLTAPGTPNTTKSIVFEMWISGQGAFGQACTLNIKTGSPLPLPGTGSISSDCDQTIVSVNQIPGKWHPGGGAGVTITNVPVVVVITETANPANTFSYIVPGGVPNSGSKPINTFDMWPGGMWPHVNYTVQIAVEGTSPADDSLTYQNNGFWNPTNNANDPGYWYSIQKFNSDTVTNCLTAPPGVAACVGSTAPAAQPGQNVTVSYQFQINNRAGRTMGGPTNNGDFGSRDSSGYNFAGVVTGGVTLVSANPQATSGPIVSWKPGDTLGVPITSVINVSMTINAATQGTYSIAFRFGGNNLSLGGSIPVPCPPVTITPVTHSFFKVTNGDIATGGGFRDPGGTCSSTAAGYVSPKTGYSASSGSYDYAGGIRSYANPSAGIGASVDFGAQALGLIIGHSGGDIGFFSKHNQLASNTGYPVDPGYGGLGGYLAPAGPSDAHCVDDFFTITRLNGKNPTPITVSSVDIGTLATGTQYSYTGTLSVHGTVGPTQRTTIYVDGDVIVDGDIKYPAKWNALSGNRTNIPYFTIIARGNITLTKDVTQLDGLYVAQPSPPNYDKGVFSTCDASSFCAKKLVVNGAVIAQRMELLRAHGTVGPSTTFNTEPAETFNYAPFIILGLPEFNPAYNSTEDLFSLPPVF